MPTDKKGKLALLTGKSKALPTVRSVFGTMLGHQDKAALPSAKGTLGRLLATKADLRKLAKVPTAKQAAALLLNGVKAGPRTTVVAEPVRGEVYQTRVQERPGRLDTGPRAGSALADRARAARRGSTWSTGSLASQLTAEAARRRNKQSLKLGSGSAAPAGKYAAMLASALL